VRGGRVAIGEFGSAPTDASGPLKKSNTLFYRVSYADECTRAHASHSQQFMSGKRLRKPNTNASLTF